MKYPQKSLLDICEVSTGKRDANHASINGKYPFFTCAEIPLKSDTFSFSGEGIILPGNGANVGLVLYCNGDFEAYQRTYVLHKFNSQVEPRYVYYHLIKEWKIKNSNFQYGSATNYIRMQNFEDYKILIPPLFEQKRTVRILEKANSIRQKRQRVIKLADDFLRSVFLDMFGDPVNNPYNWDLKAFEDLGTLARGKSKHRPRNDPRLLGGPYPLIQTGDIANANHYIKSYSGTYSELGLKQSKLWPKGTLCITIAANIADTAIMTFDACFPDSVVGFTPNSMVNTEYIHMWLSFFQKILRDQAPESAQKNINLKILSELQMPVPPKDTQNNFSEIFKKIEKLKKKLLSSSELIDNSFTSLTQRAFRGDL
ncbi:MAG: restriction endonuclease subunit S [Desulfatiglans sp.]|nr:restriction endonuclease subunit S [Desulfatiglans sp.]